MTLKLTKFFSSVSTHPCQSDDCLCIQFRNKSVASVNMVSEKVKSASSDDLVPQPIKASTVFTTSGLGSWRPPPSWICKIAISGMIRVVSSLNMMPDSAAEID